MSPNQWIWTVYNSEIKPFVINLFMKFGASVNKLSFLIKNFLKGKLIFQNTNQLLMKKKCYESWYIRKQTTFYKCFFFLWKLVLQERSAPQPLLPRFCHSNRASIVWMLLRASVHDATLRATGANSGCIARPVASCMETLNLHIFDMLA